MHPNWHQTGNFVTRAEEQRDETTQAGSVLTGCRRDCLRGGRSMDLRQPGGQQLRDTRSGSMPANSAPVCESIRAADGNRVGNNGVPEHYKQLGSHWCCRRGQLRPRDS
jgi:hypothetical protein